MTRGFASHLRRGVSRLQGERGLALPLALAAMPSLSGMVSVVLTSSSWNYGSAKRSDADRQALALAEAGLNYSYSTLYSSASPTMASAVPPATLQLETGTSTYSGTLNGSTWTLVGTGRVRNPAGPGSADVVRTVSGRAQLGSAQRGSSNNAVWNYIYVDDPSSTTTLGNSVDVNIQLYVRGNLRIQNTRQVSGYALQVGGTVEFFNEGHVGTSGAPIHESHVAGGS